MAELNTGEMRQQALDVWGNFLGKATSSVSEEIMTMTDIELCDHFNPTTTDFMLRKRFWEMTESAHVTGENEMQPTALCKGICSTTYFYNRWLKNTYRVAWLLIPIRKHQDMIDEAFIFALNKVRNEILTMPVTEKSAPVILKALEYFTNRSLGPMLQKIEQRSMNVNVDGNQAIRDALTPEDLQNRLDELKSKMISAPMKDVNDPE